MKKTLFNIARDYKQGILESRMVARKETEGRDLTDAETIKECEYILETIDHAGHADDETRQIKQACKYIIRKGAAI